MLLYFSRFLYHVLAVIIIYASFSSFCTDLSLPAWHSGLVSNNCFSDHLHSYCCFDYSSGAISICSAVSIFIPGTPNSQLQCRFWCSFDFWFFSSCMSVMQLRFLTTGISSCGLTFLTPNISSCNGAVFPYPLISKYNKLLILHCTQLKCSF